MRSLISLGAVLAACTTAGLALPSQPAGNQTAAGDSAAAGDEAGRYAGYQVIAVTPDSEEQIAWLAAFRTNYSSSSSCHLDWWSELSLPNLLVSVAVEPACLDEVIGLLRAAGLQVRVTIPDLSLVIRQERNYRFLSQLYREPHDWNPEVYHNLEEIQSRISWMVGHYPDLLSTRLLGTTHEGRKIEVVVVREPGPVTKPAIWIDCGIHAREWVSPPTCIHFIERLVESINSVEPQVHFCLLAIIHKNERFVMSCKCMTTSQVKNGSLCIQYTVGGLEIETYVVVAPPVSRDSTVYGHVNYYFRYSDVLGLQNRQEAALAKFNTFPRGYLHVVHFRSVKFSRIFWSKCCRWSH
jgi:Zinc carboxypeptidase/Carboxypeptidase activation peptide